MGSDGHLAVVKRTEKVGTNFCIFDHAIKLETEHAVHIIHYDIIFLHYIEKNNISYLYMKFCSHLDSLRLKVYIYV